MRVALICIDKPEYLEVRKANREAHLAYIAASGLFSRVDIREWKKVIG